MINPTCHETTASQAAGMVLRAARRRDRRIPSRCAAHRRLAEVQRTCGARDPGRGVAIERHSRGTAILRRGPAPGVRDCSLGSLAGDGLRRLPRSPVAGAPAALDSACGALAYREVTTFCGCSTEVLSAAQACRSLRLSSERSRVGASLGLMDSHVPGNPWIPGIRKDQGLSLPTRCSPSEEWARS